MEKTMKTGLSTLSITLIFASLFLFISSVIIIMSKIVIHKQDKVSLLVLEKIEENKNIIDEMNAKMMLVLFDAFTKKNIEKIMRSIEHEKVDKKTALIYADKIVTTSRQYNIDPLLATALFWQESRFNPLAVSSTSARGLGQIMPSTGAWIARDMGLPYTTESLFDYNVNITLSIFYLRYLLDNVNNDINAALISYYAGLKFGFIYRNNPKGFTNQDMLNYAKSVSKYYDKLKNDQ